MCIIVYFVGVYMMRFYSLSCGRSPPNSFRLFAGCGITQITSSLVGFKSLNLYTECTCINMYIYMIQIRMLLYGALWQMYINLLLQSYTNV